MIIGSEDVSQEAGEVSGPPRHDEKGNDRYEKIIHQKLVRAGRQPRFARASSRRC